MGQALYRKYRSKSLSEIVGQEHITDTLTKALKTGRISHAYLLTGPRGVGKTSIARILAHEINQLPYDETQTHIDIIEIDAASNRRIDEIRDLRDKVHIAPASAKYKVYIIDEVHMLTKEAFNALLKTLEEPPAHVIFILATTEAHKLPETIVSRTQRFIFRPIEPAKAVAHLKSIATKEEIKITDDALELLAQHGDGSFRDSISLLDQAGSNGETVDADRVRQMLGIPPTQAVAALLQTLEAGSDLQQALQQLSALYDQGFQANAIAQQLAELIRGRALAGTIPLMTAAPLLAKLLEVSVSHQPDRYLEISLLDLMATKQPSAPASSTDAAALITKTITKAPVTENPTGTVSAQSKPDTPSKAATAPAQQAKPVPDPIQEEPSPTVEPPTLINDDDEAIWNQVIEILKKKYNTLYGIVRMAKPNFTDDAVELRFAFAFHQKRAMETKNLEAIRSAFSQASGRDVVIKCSHDPNLKLASGEGSKPAATTSSAPGTPITDISNIFGTAEVIE